MRKSTKTLTIQIVLFLVTLLTTTLAGSEWITGKTFLMGFDQYSLSDFKKGFLFSIPFLGFLTTHEFGHFFMAKHIKVKVTLPYYIPMWLGPFTSIGTMGAFIRIKEEVKRRNDYFDIGIAGPLAGFVVALLVLIYGVSNLPGLDYIFQIHPEYTRFGSEYGKYAYQGMDEGLALHLGDSLLSLGIKNLFADQSLWPHPNEIVHYPLLMAGYLGLFFTALNLMPIGQLDGGHILYGLIGHKAHRIVSPVFFIAFVFYAGLGFFRLDEFQFLSSDELLRQLFYFGLYIYFIYLCFSRVTENRQTNWLIALAVVFLQVFLVFLFPEIDGFSGFLAFGFLLGRILGIYHPPTDENMPLGNTRKILGWITLLIFVLCFSPNPFY